MHFLLVAVPEQTSTATKEMEAVPSECRSMRLIVANACLLSVMELEHLL